MDRPLRANRGQNPNARWIVADIEWPKKRPPKPVKKVEPILWTGETRCSCNGAVPDSEVMAQCEKCGSWQHTLCQFGVNDESVVSDPYFCRQCSPKPVKHELDGKLEIGDKVRSIDELSDSRQSAALQIKRKLEIWGHTDPEQHAIALEFELYRQTGPGALYRAQFRKQMAAMNEAHV